PRPRSRSAGARVLVALAAWSVFAFAGAYPWTTIPLLAGVAALAFVERPRVARRPFGVLDVALAACVAAVAIQLTPLPANLRHAISPAAADFDRATRLDAPDDPLSAPARPLSLDPTSTAWALAVAGGIAVLFWSARGVFERG